MAKLSEKIRGTKRKIEIQKRETKTQRSVAFSKRRKGVFKKAAEVCVTSGAIIAVYASVPSENSDAIHSFSSHSSAYEIARCFLNNQIPSKSNPNPKSSFWWENPEFEHCEDPVQLQSLIDRLGKARDDAIAAFAKKKQNQFVLPISQNPNFSSVGAMSVETVGGNRISGGEGSIIDQIGH